MSTNALRKFHDHCDFKLQQSACLEDNVLLQMESSCTQCD